MSTAGGFDSAGPLRSPLAGPRAPRYLEVAVLAVAPGLLIGVVLVTLFSQRYVAYDFHWAYYPAAARLLHGGDPYALTRSALQSGTAFVYPAFSAVLLAPLALLGHGTADHVYSLGCLMLVPATLRTLGVRDWRVYGAVLIWLPVTVGWQGGNFSVPLVSISALVWRHRDRPAVAGLLVAVAISLKPFVWPLALWLLATRRWRASAWAVASGFAINLLTWWLVGFDRIPTFLRLSGQDAGRFWRAGYGVMAMAHRLGLGHDLAEGVMALVCIAAGASVIALGRAGRPERAFTMTVALMLLASPLVWIHYFTFLLLPLALAKPRFDPLWLLPLAMWVCPPSVTTVGWEASLAWAVALICVGFSLRSGVTARSGPRGPDVRLAHGLNPTHVLPGLSRIRGL